MRVPCPSRVSLASLLCGAVVAAGAGCASVDNAMNNVAIEAQDSGPRRDRTEVLGPKRATANLAPTYGHTASGTVQLRANKDGTVRVVADLSGLSPGEHGFHIHEKGDCSAPDAASAGDHFAGTPTKARPELGGEHGLPEEPARHAGDLGNIVADANGHATVDITDAVIALEGKQSVVGRAIIVHSARDEGTEAASARVACGVIVADSVVEAADKPKSVSVPAQSRPESVPGSDSPRSPMSPPNSPL